MDTCLYLHAHQPNRLTDFEIFDVGENKDYFDENRNKEYLNRVAKKSYLPTNKILLDLIRETEGEFKVSFSITGSLLEQLEKHTPEVIESFQKLAKTGQVEFITETYYHSFASFYSPDEFKNQVKLQQKKLNQLFGAKPEVFRNTELAFNNHLAEQVADMGYEGILTEGVDRILGWRSPNFLYQTHNDIPLLLKNYRLSDDIAFRFSEKNWEQWPLDAPKFKQWLSKMAGNSDLLNLFMDFETFGEHQWEETGIFEFLRDFPPRVLEHDHINFSTPSKVIEKYKPKDKVETDEVISWADTERDLSAWQGNKLQRSVTEKIYSLEEKVKETADKDLLEDWRHLQTTDHFYYMCTKWFEDGDVHEYFNPYDSPYEAYINYMNVIEDLEHRLERV